jgi:glutamate/tyrosine decarboxylase-like PLP-dependent enzyme
VSLLGFGTDNIEFVETDNQGRIIPDKIPELDKNSILILQAGNVNTGSFDDFDTIINQCKEKNPWIHIDGAFGLLCAAVKELKHLTKSINMADSWSFDGHKALNTPYDNGILLCRDEEAIKSAMAIAGSYINTDGNRNGIAYTPEMSRRARIIELWATLKSLGKNGLSEMIYGLHLRAKQFADELDNLGFEIINDVQFNQVLVFYKENNLTMRILKKIQDSGVCWCGSSKWKSMDVIRISVCSWVTTSKDISLSVSAFNNAKEAVDLEMNL